MNRFLTPTSGMTPSRYHDADRPLREQAKMRLLVVWGLLCCGFLMISGRLLQFGWVENTDVASTALHTDPSQEYPALARRANIVDCRGEILATSIRTASLYLKTSDVVDAAGSLKKLQGVFPDLDIIKMQQKIKEGRKFIWVKRHLTPSQQYAVLKCGILGAYFQKDERRVYLQGSLMAHALGLTNVDQEGIAGLEKYGDTSLRASDAPLKTTLDLRVQAIVHNALKEALSEFQASGAVGILMDVHTGAIRALVSLPDYDLNQPQDLSSSRFMNKATTGVWEMGSIFKVLTVAMALESGSTSLKNRYDATQPLHMGRFKITDFQAKNRWLSLPEVLVYSSNIGTSRVALELGGQTQQAFLRKMGLLDPLSLELPETSKPLVPARWSDVTTMTVSYGYGLSVTPVQVLSAVSCLVNGGTLHKPTLLEECASKAHGQQVLRPSVSSQMCQLMRMVVLEGSGKRAHVPGFGVLGKTGTAYLNGQGRYNKEGVRTTFVGAFPASQPRYALMVMLEDPHATPATFGFRTAGWNAAAVAGRIIERVVVALGLSPMDERTFDDKLPWHLIQDPRFVHAAHRHASE